MADIIGNKPGTPGSPKKRVTVSADRENRSPSSADYRKPIVRSAVRRWKKLHEQNMMQKLVGLRNEKKQSVKISRESARKIARKIPTEMLAKEWLNDNEATLEVRAYLVDRVLPTLILGVEKLLNEAHDRGLTEANESDANFNPLNMLASYLMRNNPKYSNFSESSPYVRGLREVAEELKRQLFNIEDNRLARIKAEARRRREERDKQERLKQLEQERRERAFMDQFAEWNIQHDGRVELALVQNALRSFVEIAENFPEEWANSSRLSRALEPTDESGKALTVKEFAKYLGLYIEDFSKEIFDEFMVHLSKCAKFHKTAANQEARRILLTNLFISCDHSGIGLLDRHRILSLFEKFWDAMKEDVKHNLRNPRRWPVVEVDEAIDFDDDDDDEANDLVEKPNEPVEQKAKPVTPAQKDKVEEKQKEDTDKTNGNQTQENLTEKPEIENVQKTESEEAKKTEEKVDESQKEAQKSSDKADEESKKEEAVEEKPKEAEKKDDKEEKAKEEEKVQKKSTEAAAEKKKEEKPAEKEEAKPGEIKMEVKVDAKEEEKKEEAKEGEIKMEVKMDAKEEEKKEEAKTEETKKEDKTETKEKVEEKRQEEESKSQDKSEAKKDEDDKKDAEEKKDEVAKAESEEKPEDKGKPLGEAPSSKVDSSKTEGEKEENDENKDKPADAPAADKTEVSEGGDKAASPTQPQEPASEGPKEGDQPAEDKPSFDKPVEEAKETAAPEVPSTDKDTAVAAEPAGKLEVPKTPKASDGQQEQLSVTFAEGTAFEREKTAMTTLSKTSGASAFDENSLNVSQFVQLTETFLGEDPVNKQTFDSLARSIKEGYEETEEEKMERLMKARKEALSSQRKQQMDALFEKWDNDGAGYLDLDEVETVMQKYKEGQEIEAIERAKHSLKKQAKYAQDNRLSRREFRQFITLVTNEMPGADNFDYFVEFLVNSVERTYAERIRGEARKKWLQQVVSAAETSGASLEPVYKAVFSALYKDAEAHGGGKRVSANISMLERNCTAPGRGDVCLRYVAATVDDADFLLGKILYKDMKGISFAAVESGKPIHVPRVNNHGNLHFWNPYRVPEDREGSFIVVPLQDRKKRVFGLLGVDTLNDRHTKTIFITHEIMFFQGVSKSFSIAYHYIDMRKKLLRITESAVSWIHRRSPHVQEVVTYMVESDGNEKDKDYVLRKMMVTDPKGNVVNINNPPRLERKDNLFRDYLFRCVDNSENVSADAYGQRHIGFPLRDDQGRAVAVVDISIGELKALPSHENKEVQRMLRLLQLAHKEITRESAGDEKMAVLEGEKDEDNRMDIMFDRLMLIELRENVSKIDAKSFAEIKSYNDPPPIVGDIVKAVCAIFYLDKAESGELDNWGALRALINQELLQKIEHYDPTSAANLVPPEKIEVYLKDVPHGEVGKFGSIPAQNLYNWVFVCLSLIEHTLKMRQNTNEGAVTPANK